MKTLKLNTGSQLHKKLSRLHKPPMQLYSEGEDDLEQLLSLPSVAIVGSRKMSPYGRAITEKFARQLADRGVVIISGLAFGVDITAHIACLGSGRGKTIAVLGTPINEIYPKAHENTARQIIKGSGCVVSEYQTGQLINKYNFIERDRIIAALSDVVFIPEAAEKSGSLHTAGFALDAGISVAVAPGPITSELSAGTNNLLKQGAAPITKIDDLFDLLGINTDEATDVNLIADTQEQTLILQLIHRGISDTDEILANCKFSPEDFNQALTMLELEGRIKSIGMGSWRIT